MNVSKSVLTVAATLCGLLCGCGGSSAGERSAPAERATRKNISLIEGVSPLYGATVPQGSVQRIGFRLRHGAEADSGQTQEVPETVRVGHWLISQGEMEVSKRRVTDQSHHKNGQKTRE